MRWDVTKVSNDKSLQSLYMQEILDTQKIVRKLIKEAQTHPFKRKTPAFRIVSEREA